MIAFIINLEYEKLILSQALRGKYLLRLEQTLGYLLMETFSFCNFLCELVETVVDAARQLLTLSPAVHGRHQRLHAVN